jgi:hypothetical protein
MAMMIKAGSAATVIKNPIPKLFQNDFETVSADLVKWFLNNFRYRNPMIRAPRNEINFMPEPAALKAEST